MDHSKFPSNQETGLTGLDWNQLTKAKWLCNADVHQELSSILVWSIDQSSTAHTFGKLNLTLGLGILFEHRFESLSFGLMSPIGQLVSSTI